MLALLVLVCPYNCIGSVIPFESAKATGCCCASETDEDDTARQQPQEPDEECDGACKSCLCGGAVTSDDLSSLQRTNDHLANAELHDIPYDAFSCRVCQSQAEPRVNPAINRSGVALRAFLQSFLL
jgi:hypothetical protein